jgi:hypothetical protein
MQRNHTTGLFFVLVCLQLVSAALPAAQPGRIAGPIDNRNRVSLKGQIHPKALPENDQGRVDASLTLPYVTVRLKPSAAQQADLDQLLAQQQDPSSPNYHRWLTPEEYADRFGVSQSDVDQIAAWLKQQHLTVAAIARGRNWVAFSGGVRDVESAFGTEIHRYMVDGEMHYANAAEPSIPAALGPVVSVIHGLHDFRLRPAARLPQRLPRQANYNTGRGGHYLAPDDFATIYNIQPLYNSGIDGTGQKVVVVGQTQVALSDIQQFRSYFNLSANDPQFILVPNTTDPGISQGDLLEADLDIELSGAVARNASIIYVYSDDVEVSAQYAVDQNVAPVLSMSYGLCEALTIPADANAQRTLAQQANAQGMTWIAASGDDGAADCYGSTNRSNLGLSVDLPGSIPEVTSIGGTEFAEGSGNYWNAANSANHASALSYIPETSWNDSASVGSPTASGGGASAYFTKPTWQTGLGVPNDGARDVPDVSLSSSPEHDPYMIYSNGSIEEVGGTSVGAPSFAGMVALLNHYLVSKGLQGSGGVGNVNPRLYALAQTFPNVFHDITTGNNLVDPCPPRSRSCNPAPIGFSAGPGYDLVTGLGSMDAFSMVTSWGAGGAVSRSAANLLLSTSATNIAPDGATILTATVRSSTTATPTGTVTFLLGTTTLGTATLAGSNGAAAANLTVNGTQLALGSDTITARYNGDSSFLSATATVTITVAVVQPPGGTTDLALGKTATQSSTFPGDPTAVASSAVDGKVDGNFFDGSVTATNLDPNPWWQVDLGASASVSSIVVWNRTDCCSARLNDYWVFVSNTPFLATDTPTTLQNRAGTWSSHQTMAPNPSTAITASAQGRYVRVQLTSANYLSLAEVQVFGTGAPAISNLALGKTAAQSSTFSGYPTAVAGLAVDGNPDGNFYDGSVTATNLDPNPWWQVDLGASAMVSSIVVWNRTDCCGSRLGDYWVFVSNTPFLVTDTPSTLQNRAGTFSIHQTSAPNPSSTIATVAQGRYVRVQLSSANYLSLAEVQVFGQ